MYNKLWLPNIRCLTCFMSSADSDIDADYYSVTVLTVRVHSIRFMFYGIRPHLLCSVSCLGAKVLANLRTHAKPMAVERKVFRS